MKFKTIFAVSALAVFIISTCGCTAVTSNPLALQVNAHGTTNDLDISSKDVHVIAHPASGNKFVWVNVTLKALEDNQFISILGFTLKDSTGRSYGIEGNGPYSGTLTDVGAMRTGETRTGVVAFEVPRNATAATLVYDNLLGNLSVNL